LENSDGLDLYAQATLGIEADSWWKSPLGRYVLQRSLSQTEAIRTQFKTVDPNDSKAVARLQTDWAVAEGALVWIQEAIAAGKQAMDLLEIEKER
jgi:hypothetical protein